MSSTAPQGPGDFNKDRVDGYLRCAEASWKDMDTRRVYEWKISLGLWTALGAFAAIMLRGEANLSPCVMAPISLLLLLIGCLYVVPWTKGLRERQLRSLNTFHYFLDRAEDALGTNSARKKFGDVLREEFAGKEAEENLIDILKHWAHGSQIIVTWIFVAVALLSMWIRVTQ